MAFNPNELTENAQDGLTAAQRLAGETHLIQRLVSSIIDKELPLPDDYSRMRSSVRLHVRDVGAGEGIVTALASHTRARRCRSSSGSEFNATH